MPVVILVVGMAGSGKTTFMQRLNASILSMKKTSFVINLDPAVLKVPYKTDLDIRDKVDYKKVMQDFNLGPNGAIVTSLNLFTTKFNEVLDTIETKKDVDASGAIITETLASIYPTLVTYIVDTPRTTSPSTFMSNMLYACSIMYKTKLPFLLTFNKIDLHSHQYAVDWMQDFQLFQSALMEKSNGDDSFMTSLNNSMCLMLDEFYCCLRYAGVSSLTGAGMEEYFQKVAECAEEYEGEYKTELQQLRDTKKRLKNEGKDKQIEKLMNDLKLKKEMQ